jgi:hypothetical protein
LQGCLNLILETPLENSFNAMKENSSSWLIQIGMASFFRATDRSSAFLLKKKKK